MSVQRAALTLEKYITPVSRVVNNIGVSFLVVMMVLITLDVCLRALFNFAVLGSYVYEAIEFMMVVLIFFGLSYCEIQKSNVGVDVLVSRFPEKAQAVIDVVTYLLGIGFFIILTWRCIEQAFSVREAGTVAVALSVPVYPFFLVAALGTALLCLALILNFLHILTRFAKK